MTLHAPHRTRLPATRQSVTRKVEFGGFEMYVTVGFFDDGTANGDMNRPGEVFVKISKHGTEISGLMDTVATFLSISLQYGVPWAVLESKMRHTRFGTPAIVNGEERSSLIDCIAVTITEVIEDRAKMLGLDEPEAAPVEGPAHAVQE